MTADWRPTQALTRAGFLSAALTVLAVTTGRADLLVFSVPFLLHAWLGALARPGTRPTVRSRVGHAWLREGDGTVSRTRIEPVEGVEYAAVQLTPCPFTVFNPRTGAFGRSPRPGAQQLDLDLSLASLRWGVRPVGGGMLRITSAWAAYAIGPAPFGATGLRTLPVPGPFGSRAPVPHPIGLVGTNPARRPGEGSEFAGIRPFLPGDRLRRIQWRVSLRTAVLHVTTSVAEEDTSVLLLVDATVDVGASGGIDGAASSLDLTVRAAGALSEHYLAQGDRVGMRVIGPVRSPVVDFGGGHRHLRRVLDTLARIVPVDSLHADTSRLRFRVPAGAVVFVLSPMLGERPVAATMALARRGLTVAVVDTLPDGFDRGDVTSTERIAWRIRLLERDALLLRVARAGVPVVAWRGPGTLDQVLRGLARRPSAVARR